MGAENGHASRPMRSAVCRPADRDWFLCSCDRVRTVRYPPAKRWGKERERVGLGNDTRRRGRRGYGPGHDRRDGDEESGATTQQRVHHLLNAETGREVTPPIAMMRSARQREPELALR